mgnify:FL=1|jgi:hypothetical protein
MSTLRDKQRGEGELSVIIVIACIAAWITHVVVCLSAGKWGFLIAGALVFPIAIIHGFGIWLGAW